MNGLKRALKFETGVEMCARNWMGVVWRILVKFQVKVVIRQSR